MVKMRTVSVLKSKVKPVSPAFVLRSQHHFDSSLSLPCSFPQLVVKGGIKLHWEANLAGTGLGSTLPSKRTGLSKPPVLLVERTEDQQTNKHNRTNPQNSGPCPSKPNPHHTSAEERKVQLQDGVLWRI